MWPGNRLRTLFVRYDKYVSVKLNAEDVEFTFGEWKMLPGAEEPQPVQGKSATLSSKQFLRLCGIILTGQAELDEAAMVAPTQLPPLLHLGDNMYFGWSRFKSSLVATIRVYRRSNKGDLYPTRSGFSFGELSSFLMKPESKQKNCFQDHAAMTD